MKNVNLTAGFPGLAVAFVVVVAAWGFLGRPQSVPDAPPGKVHCVSYTPFRGDDSPFDPLYVADPRQIEEDLRLVSQFAECIRLYAPDQGLGAAIPAAEKFGLKVLLGIWIGGDPVANERQIALAISLAKSHRDTVKAMIVGNEVLLRGEQTPKTMADLARRVKSETGLPVTYADVTDFWLTAPPLLADAVDFITIHILPYWEDHPASAEGGLEVVESAVARVQALFPGKPVFIGETGFPSRGRERQSAVPSLVSEARYLRGFMAYAARAGVDYNLIEAFDQPWKRLLEGTAGGYWGMYDSARAPKFPWRGAVSNHPDWPVEAGASFVVALLALVAWVASGLIANWRRAAFFGVAAGAGGVLLVLQAEHSWAAWRAIPELMIEALLFVQSCAALLLLPPAVAARPGEIDPFSHCLAWLRRPHLPVDRVLGLGLLRFTVSVTALVVSLGLAFDPRYRDFPNAAFALPALAFAAIALKRGDAFRPAPLWREEAALAALFALSAAIILVNETPLNLAADLWCAIVALLILPLAGALRALPVSLGRAATA